MTSLVFLLLSVFVVIQSVYGIGILIFGVPTLLIYGLDYFSVIGLLIPSSILISILQIIKRRNIEISEVKLIPLATVGIGIATGSFFFIHFHFRTM